MRYYYTDPLRAAWMMRELGLKFEGYANNYPVAFCHEMISEDKMNGRREKYYIHPDCHEMLKPQVDDVVEFDGFVYGLVNNIDADEIAIQCDDVFYVRDIEECVIIQRNGKAFFTPEVEDE